MTPKELGFCLKGWELKQKEKEIYFWKMTAAYLIPGLAISTRKGAWGKDNLEYPQNPVIDKCAELNGEEDLQRQREEFVLNMRLRKVNWDLSHPKK